MAKKVMGGIDPAARIVTKVGAMLTPSQIASSGSEHAHQAAVMQWCAIEGRTRLTRLEMLFAIPNGGDRQASVAASLKAEGVKAGVPDLMLPVPRGAYAGLWIEMKKPSERMKRNGGRSDKQVEWHKKLVEQRYAVVVAYGWQAAVCALLKYYDGGWIMLDNGDALSVDEKTEQNILDIQPWKG